MATNPVPNSHRRPEPHVKHETPDQDPLDVGLQITETLPPAEVGVPSGRGPSPAKSKSAAVKKKNLVRGKTEACPDCGMTVIVQFLQEHIDAEHRNIRRTCTICAAQVKYKAQLNRHMKKEHPETVGVHNNNKNNSKKKTRPNENRERVASEANTSNGSIASDTERTANFRTFIRRDYDQAVETRTRPSERRPRGLERGHGQNKGRLPTEQVNRLMTEIPRTEGPRIRPRAEVPRTRTERPRTSGPRPRTEGPRITWQVDWPQKENRQATLNEPELINLEDATEDAEEEVVVVEPVEQCPFRSLNMRYAANMRARYSIAEQAIERKRQLAELEFKKKIAEYEIELFNAQIEAMRGNQDITPIKQEY